MKRCQHCDKKSIPGLVKSIGLCQYHYNKRMWGEAWAEHCKDKK